MKTLREIFDTVKAHLLTQNEQAQGQHRGIVGCRYLTSDGKRCAVGVLIKDVYNELCEGAWVDQLSPSAGKWLLGPISDKSEALAQCLNDAGIPATPECKQMLNELQALHDSNPPPTWAGGLDRIERKYFPDPPC